MKTLNEKTQVFYDIDYIRIFTENIVTGIIRNPQKGQWVINNRFVYKWVEDLGQGHTATLYMDDTVVESYSVKGTVQNVYRVVFKAMTLAKYYTDLNN